MNTWVCTQIRSNDERKDGDGWAEGAGAVAVVDDAYLTWCHSDHDNDSDITGINIMMLKS